MGSDTWFRFYNTALDHPKVMLLNDTQFRAWLALLCMASKLGGIIPNDIPLIAMTLRKSPQKAADLFQVLLSANLIDPTEGGYVPHNWDLKQFQSDNSTERVKRFRERFRNVSETDHIQRQSQKQKEKSNGALLERFEEFWKICPKKTGKGAAEKAWIKAISLADPNILISRMMRYAQACRGKDQAYIKTPGPWLNEKRWLDEDVSRETLNGEFQVKPCDDDEWFGRWNAFRNKQIWAPEWGPKLGEPGCLIPQSVQEKIRQHSGAH